MLAVSFGGAACHAQGAEVHEGGKIQTAADRRIAGRERGRVEGSPIAWGAVSPVA